MFTAVVLGLSFPDSKALAKELIQRGLLTPYQANQLLNGKGQELVLGSYLLLERLGEGGMGQVFKARHRNLGRIAAIKLIRKDRLDNANAVKRFQREVRSAAALSHPNVVLAYDADEIAGTHLLVMEYIEGATDLAKLVRKHGPLPIDRACECVRQAALGLQHACERGMVHRDIKPANLLLTTDGKVVKVLDMGLARLDLPTEEDEQSSTMTQEGAVMGTPDYIAPEQALNTHTVDIRADLYSLGCTFYFLLTGRAPFPGGTLLQKLNKHQNDEPLSVEKLRPEVPHAIAKVVRKLMAKKPEDRYQTPAELASVLAALAQARSGVAVAAVAEALTIADQGLPALKDGSKDTLASALGYIEKRSDTEAYQAPQSLRKQPKNRRWLAVTAATCLAAFAGLAILLLLTRGSDKAPQKREDREVVTKEVPRKEEEPRPQQGLPKPVEKPVPGNVARFALRYDGNGRAEAASLVLPQQGPHCMEAYVTLLAPPTPKKAGSYVRIVGNLQANLSIKPTQLGFVLYTQAPRAEDTAATKAASPSLTPLGKRCHLAGVHSDTEIRLYIDGKLVDKKPVPAHDLRAPTAAKFAIGFTGFQGLLEEVRISKVARYDQDFPPAQRFAPDQDTIALYHFDEGFGDVLHDSSGNGHHGKIVGAKWAQAAETRPTGATVDLLKLIDLKRDVIEGNWTFLGNTLVTPPGKRCRLVIPYAPPPEYQIEMQLERKGGGSGLNIGFLVEDRQTMLVIDGWKRAFTGLETLDGRMGNDNETSHQGELLPLHRSTTVLLRVRKQEVTFICDGRTIFQWNGASARVGLIKSWTVPNPRSLFLGSQAVFHVHQLTLTPLEPKDGTANAKAAAGS